MQKRKLGKTDIYFTDISMGCWEIGGLEDPSWFMSAKDACELVSFACENGIRSFDVADLYGNGRAEILLGQGIKNYLDSVIITKVGQLIGLDGDTAYFLFDKIGGNTLSDFSYDYIKFACNQSLKRLQRSYIDIYLLHNPSINDINNESIRALEDLKKEGKIRATGVSSTTQEVLLKCASENLVDAVEVLFSVAYPLNEDLVTICKNKGVGIIGRSPFMMPSMTKGGLFKNKKYLQLAKESNMSLPQYAIQKCLDSKEISTLVVGMKNKFEITENVSFLENKKHFIKNSKFL